MHTEQTTNFSVRVAHADLGITGGDVVWMPSPVGHSTGFNYGLRFALYHGLPLVLQDRWDAGRRRSTSSQPERASLHAGRDDVPPGPGRGVGPRRHAARLACAASGAVAHRSRPTLVGAAAEQRHPRAAALRLDRGARRHVEPARLAARAAHGHRRHRHDRRRGRDPPPTTGGRARRARPGEIFVRGPNTCVGFFADPERTAATFDADGWVRSGDLAIGDGDGLPHRGRPQEGDHHPRRHQHRAARDRGAASSPGPRSSGRPWSVCPTSGSASAPARASSCAPGADADLRDDGRAAPRGGARHVQAAGAARGPRRAADHRVGQGPEARDRAPDRRGGDGEPARAEA